MAIKEYRGPSGPNDTLASGLEPNDHNSNLAAARAASVAAEKAKREASDRAAAEINAKAAKNANDLAACKAEVIALKAQLNELQQHLKTKSDELADAKNGIENLKRHSSQLSSSNEQLQSELSQCKAERDSNWSMLQERTADRDRHRSALEQRTRDLDNGVIFIREIKWGDKDLTNDGNAIGKVQEYVKHHWAIPFKNDFFGCDPNAGNKKRAVVRFWGSRTFEGWEGEQKPTFP